MAKSTKSTKAAPKKAAEKQFQCPNCNSDAGTYRVPETGQVRCLSCFTPLGQDGPGGEPAPGHVATSTGQAKQ